ncbi:uncharacterized protein LOC119318185 isoform X3 [Triticum dicoccoides]|uniref:uncharacterized protein LOC119318185 isoform X3 n=1 Tax=Triticum dicoccoides TaxID=85692 RepID=UPI0018918600|nr:uncharacterized protein LOC119318185 isoform X3 [Triticum dicoccoides]
MLILQKIFFVPNDFADENAMSLDFSGDDEEFDKALYNFYLNNKVKYLKRKLSSSCRRNVKRSSDSLFVQHSLDILESSSQELLMACVLDEKIPPDLFM